MPEKIPLLTKEIINKIISFFHSLGATKGYPRDTPIGEIANHAYHHWIRVSSEIDSLRAEVKRLRTNYDLMKISKESLEDENKQLQEKLDVLRWRECTNNVPQENYFGNYDWVLVKVKESDTGWENPIPQIAEYQRNGNKWSFQNEAFKEYHDSLIVLCWRPIENILK